MVAVAAVVAMVVAVEAVVAADDGVVDAAVVVAAAAAAAAVSNARAARTMAARPGVWRIGTRHVRRRRGFPRAWRCKELGRAKQAREEKSPSVKWHL